MNHKRNSRRTKLLLFSALAVQLALAWSMPRGAAALDGHHDDDLKPVQVGYAIITPDTASSELMVFETFGEHHGGQTTQAGVLPSAMTTHAVLFVNASGRLSRNVGVAIANPGSTPADITLTLYADDGTAVGTPVVFTLEAGAQTARYVTEFFATRPEVMSDFTGTLDLVSIPAVAVLGIRSRGENFSTMPATNLSGPNDVPDLGDGVGGAGAIILAHFAVGGGWATEIVIANAGSDPATVRVDLFGQDGEPLIVTLNDQTGGSFAGITVPGHGVVTLAPRDERGDSDF